MRGVGGRSIVIVIITPYAIFPGSHDQVRRALERAHDGCSHEEDQRQGSYSCTTEGL